jgi:hypothetical protein
MISNLDFEIETSRKYFDPCYYKGEINFEVYFDEEQNGNFFEKLIFTYNSLNPNNIHM